MTDDFALQLVCPVGGRESHDHYPTPPSAVAPLVALAQGERWWAPGEAVLDPCCGEGELLDALRDLAGLCPQGLELDATRAQLARQRGHEVTQGDALALPWSAALVVSNPPFAHAEAFARAALERRPPRGLVCLLLPLAFAETPGRARLHREAPADVYVLARRPSFTGKKHTPRAVAWWVWGRGGGRWWVIG